MNSALRLEIADFLRELEMPLTLEFEGCDEHCRYFYFSRPKHSTTLFVISDDGAGNWQVMIDGLASYEDYRFFPYLADCLRIHLQAEVEGLEAERLSISILTKNGSACVSVRRLPG